MLFFTLLICVKKAHITFTSTPEYIVCTAQLDSCVDSVLYLYDSTSNNVEIRGCDKILDINGNELQNGDSVIVMKDLPVKGAPKPVKAGTKVKNIRLVDGDHDIDCKVDGISMGLKSEFVKKA